MKSNSFNTLDEKLVRKALSSLLAVCFAFLILLSQSISASADQKLTWSRRDTSKVYEVFGITINCPANHVSSGSEGDYKYKYDTGAGSGEKLTCGTVKIFNSSNIFYSAYVIALDTPALHPCSVSVDDSQHYSGNGTIREGDMVMFTINYAETCPSPKNPEPPLIPLPEDEIGAYFPGTTPRTYAWFHTKASCLKYLDDPDMCVWPQVNE